MKFEPLRDWLLLEEMPIGESMGGIVMPDSADTGPPRAKVVASGPGRLTEENLLQPTGVIPGDIVRLLPVTGSVPVITVEGKDYWLARAVEVVAREGYVHNAA